MIARARLWLAAAALLGACDGGPVAPLRPDAAPPADAPLAACASEPGVRARVFAPRCGDSDCHDADRPRAGLDLVSPGVAGRLAGVRSVHDPCADRQLVVPGVARASFLLDKVLGTQGECGDPMPLEAPLSLEERRCLVEWIDAMR